MSNNRKDFEQLTQGMAKQYGDKAVSNASAVEPVDVIPTGILALDYALGIGGWPRGHICGVFGPRDIGKSSIIGLNAIRNAQAQGLYCAIVLVEPHFDAAWAQAHGVNTDNLLITRPENGKVAFDHLAKIVSSGAVGLVLFDSVGALLSPSEAEIDGNMKAGGQAGLITWGVKRILQPAYANQVAVLMLNQVRDNMNSPYANTYQQPGGHHLEHAENIIVQLKRVSGAAAIYKEKQDGEEVQVGQQLVAHVLRNKLAEGTGQKAVFDFYQKRVGDRFGVDSFEDVINTGVRLGIIERKGAYYDTPDGKHLQGKDALREHLAAKPEALAAIREGVLKIMRSKAHRPDLKAVGE